MATRVGVELPEGPVYTTVIDAALLQQLRDWAHIVNEADPSENAAERKLERYRKMDRRGRASRPARLRAGSELSGELRYAPNTLARLNDSLEDAGWLGERDAARLLYLAMTSRLLDKPMSVVVKGHPAAGRSDVSKKVPTHQSSTFFPEKSRSPLMGPSASSDTSSIFTVVSVACLYDEDRLSRSCVR